MVLYNVVLNWWIWSAVKSLRLSLLEMFDYLCIWPIMFLNLPYLTYINDQYALYLDFLVKII